MDKKQTPFERVLDQVTQRMKKAQKTLLLLQEVTEAKKMEIAYATAFNLAHETEKMTLLTRVLPAYTGHPLARTMATDMIKETIPVNIGFTSEGWFVVFLPALLPKKHKGSAMYIQDIIYPAMSRFFSEKVPARYPDCVLVYRHVYNRNRPERQYRDHDNIELNMVTDAVAFYTMKDDNPLQCCHYYCSAAGNEDRTEVYVVPQPEFTDWLAAERSFPDEGIELLENRP